MQNATTKEQAHTAGPWLYRPDKYDDWGFVRAQPEQGRLLGGVICQARDPYALDDVTLNAHRRAKTDPWEANARLIAAAPDLLEALQLVWDTYGMDPSRRNLLIGIALAGASGIAFTRSEEHTSELQSLMRISYAVFCLKKKTTNNKHLHIHL